MGDVNRTSGASPEELHERAVAALVRVWGVTDAEAREAILRVKLQERRLRRNAGPAEIVAAARAS